MSEVTFAKSFLATLDKRAIKLPADHVSDPRKYESQSPYILPRQTHPFPRRTPASRTAQEKTITATLKPMKAGETISLSEIALDTTIHDLKTQYAQKSGLQQDKIKFLLNKKPTADLKTLKDIGIDSDVEFSVMIMGGGATPTPQSPAIQVPPASTTPVPEKMDIDEKGSAPESEEATIEAEKKSEDVGGASNMLRTDEFWSDLQGFLEQRLRDEKEGKRLVGIFREVAGR